MRPEDWLGEIRPIDEVLAMPPESTAPADLYPPLHGLAGAFQRRFLCGTPRQCAALLKPAITQPEPPQLIVGADVPDADGMDDSDFDPEGG